MNRDQRGKTDLLLIFIIHAVVYNARTFQYNIDDFLCYELWYTYYNDTLWNYAYYTNWSLMAYRWYTR